METPAEAAPAKLAHFQMIFLCSIVMRCALDAGNIQSSPLSIPFGRKVDIDTSFTFMDPAVFVWSRQYITRRDGVANGGALNELAADALCSKGKNGYLMKLRLKIHTAG